MQPILLGLELTTTSQTLFPLRHTISNWYTPSPVNAHNEVWPF